MRRRLPVVAGLALAAASIALVVLAVQAWRHPGHVAREDARLQAGPPADAWADTGEGYSQHRGWTITCLWCGHRSEGKTKREALASYDQHAERMSALAVPDPKETR